MTQRSLPRWTEPDGEVLIVQNPPIHNAEHNRRFIPPSADTRPYDIFSAQYNRCSIQAIRYIANNDRGTVLMHIDGACLGNGQDDPRAGFGVFFRTDGNIAQRLEKPPNGLRPTSNRAELRAAICALQMRRWNGEGFNRIVLATDSEYLTLGVCDRLPRWIQRGWRTSGGTPLANKDLWHLLLQEIMKFENKGVRVQFWRIPRELNAEADALAKRGANSQPEYEEFSEVMVLDI